MGSRKQDFHAFLADVEASGRFPKVTIPPPQHGKIATISGELSSRKDHDAIVEMARQHGFLLLAQGLVIPCQRGG